MKLRTAIALAAAITLRAQHHMGDMNAAEMQLMNYASGTSTNPDSWPMPMVMRQLGSWNAMLMANAFITSTQQTGPRGHDKFFSTNWMMSNFQHRVGSRGAFQFDLMLSLEPATVTNRSYPLLFQTGETAFGVPLVDAQHPHNFIMALGFHYTHQLGENTMVDAYFAPVGDPALGPVAYPHRASAMELPQATLSHHWQDSTHIADDVITLGLTHKKIRVEASGFHGSEPGENRWIIESGPIDSWSARVWYFPSPNWAAQISMGRLAHPEALEPGDRVRSTASLSYTKGGWSSSLIWGRNHDTATHRNLNSYLVESVAAIRRKNFITGRFELVDKDELFETGAVYRIGAYTIGYTRDIGSIPHLQSGIGANVSFYTLPDAIKPDYGDHPMSVNVYLRLRLR